MGLASRTLKINPGEGHIAGLLVSLMFVSLASLTIGESGIEGLFFDRVGPRSLPVMYVLQGAVMFVAMLGISGVLGRVSRRRAYLLAPLVLGAVVLLERALLFAPGQWIYPALWLTVALGTLVQSVSLWGTAGEITDTRQAKRLFPIFAGGGFLGSVIGGLTTPPLAAAIGAENLLIVWAAGLGLAFVVCCSALGRPAGGRTGLRVAARSDSALRDIGQGLRYVRRSRLLVWMTAGAVLFSVLFYSLYLPYAREATERFPDVDQLAGFFGVFWAAGTAAAFVVSTLLTNRLFAWFGAAAMVAVLPFLYGGAFGMLLASSGFVTLVALRFVIGTWLQGVATPGWETLINIAPASRRDQARAFLNGGPTQVGVAIAGAVALVGQALTSRQFAMIGLVTAGLTVIAVIGIRRSYAGALVDALRAGRPHVFEPTAHDAPTVPSMDADALRALRQASHAEDVHVRRVAFELLAATPHGQSQASFLAGLRDPDPLVRLSAVRGLDSSSPPARDALLGMVDDADPAVSAAASARVIGLAGGSRPGTRLRELLRVPDEGIRRSVVEQLAYAPCEDQVVMATGLLSDPSAVVRSAALERLAAVAPEAALEPALAALREPQPEVRAAAGRALGSVGDRAVGPILAALGDPRTTEAAIEAARHVDGHGHLEQVRAYVESAAAHARRDGEVAASVPTERSSAALLKDALLDRARRTARSGLWALTMLVPDRVAMEAGLENLEDAEPGQLANALETLEVTADPAIVRPLLSLWERSGVRKARPGRDWLDEALHDEDELIRRFAELVRAEDEGGDMTPSTTALSTVERVLLLRQVPLLAGLTPTDLERVASIADEAAYADGEVIAAEGEIGEELHLIVAGTVRVVRGRDGAESLLARRAVGEVVGEMSLITRTPRVASLVADGEVRTIRMGRREFQSILRERPSVALGVMRVLAERLGERSGIGI